MKRNNKGATSSKKTHTRTFQPKQVVLIMAATCLLVASLTGNIVQCITYNKTNLEYNEQLSRLNNYRDLQNKQIKAAFEKCNNAKKTTESGTDDSIIRSIVKQTVRDSGTKYFNQYLNDYNLSQCYSVVYAILGRDDLVTFDSNDLYELSTDGQFSIKDTVFDGVKW